MSFGPWWVVGWRGFSDFARPVKGFVSGKYKQFQRLVIWVLFYPTYSGLISGAMSARASSDPRKRW